MKDYIQVGKKITYLLRHDPEDLKMDKNGYGIKEDPRSKTTGLLGMIM